MGKNPGMRVFRGGVFAGVEQDDYVLIQDFYDAHDVHHVCYVQDVYDAPIFDSYGPDFLSSQA